MFHSCLIGGIMKISFLSFVFISIFLCSCSTLTTVQNKNELALFDKLVDEIKRVDGDGLIPRKNRPDDWNTIIDRLRSDLGNAKSKYEIGQVFKRLDLSYPNIHSHLTLSKEYDYHQVFGRVQFPFKIRYEEVSNAVLKKKLKIIITDEEAFSNIKKEDRPQNGEEIIAINARDINAWHREAFNYCKYPLEKQCAVGFWDSFRKEFFSWDRSKALFLTFKRNEREWTIKAPLKIPTTRIVQSNGGGQKNEIYQCKKTRPSYPGFKLVYGGFNVCVYEAKNIPNTVVLKIRSFRYRGLPASAKIQHIGEETRLFWKNYWMRKAPKTEHLIIDVVENMGGDSPMKWYALFFPKDFQEQYVQFKKIKELDEISFREALFYSEESKENTFAKWKNDGIYNSIPLGKFLPNMQQFCGDSKHECVKAKFHPRNK